MSSTLGVEEFLQRSLPEWNDETRMQARLRAFSTQDENFESHFEFWRGVILLVARAHLQATIIKTEEVRNVMFKRGGLKPLGLDQVLVEMHRRRQLQSFRGLMGSYDRSWIRWSVVQLARSATVAKQVVGGLLGGEDASGIRLDEEMVIMDLLKERADKVETEITPASGHTVLLLDPVLLSIHQNPREAQLVLHELLRRRRVALVSTVAAGKEVRGVKVAARGEKRVPAVTDQDRQRVHLKSAMRGLEERAEALMRRAAEARETAHSAVKKKDRALGLRCLRRFKLWEGAARQCNDYAAKLEELLLQVDQAEVTQQVTSALQAGVQTLRASTVTLEEAESCMQQVDGALTSHQEVQDTLGLGAGENSDAIDSELAEIEAEIAMEGLSLDSAKKVKPKKDAEATSIPGDTEASASQTVVQISSIGDWQAGAPEPSGSAELSVARAAQGAPTKGENMQSERTSA
ncbi:charged multivesicular body protein 7 [Klebsormidium nitens]|uniref:Charged multivesicular body protein 7 n=1 Tax=Klebsormidium nitens TaxID=105231 RepID=A0A1Y1HWV2_KLENI|nr:charged multivesicular body protein 7 [Klebsormidium nitens]|eukprot:GAQ81451.1 charged multivesicular body protein 7 [Klebsormidium nitens]